MGLRWIAVQVTAWMKRLLAAFRQCAENGSREVSHPLYTANRTKCVRVRTLLYPGEHFRSLQRTALLRRITILMCFRWYCPVLPQLKILGHAKKVKGSVLVEVRPHDRLITIS